MLVELRLVEQRYEAVREVLDGASVTVVARRFGVARQTVHAWLVRYACGGLAGWADQSSRPLSCPHQMAPEVEARMVEMRREHPRWGPRTILYWLEREGFDRGPGRASVERCLIGHGLVTPQPRQRRREDYRRWERSRSMELWQMDIVGGVRLDDGSEAKIVSGKASTHLPGLRGCSEASRQAGYRGRARFVEGVAVRALVRADPITSFIKVRILRPYDCDSTVEVPVGWRRGRQGRFLRPVGTTGRRSPNNGWNGWVTTIESRTARALDD
jgi:transposase